MFAYRILWRHVGTVAAATTAVSLPTSGGGSGLLQLQPTTKTQCEAASVPSKFPRANLQKQVRRPFSE